MATPHPGDAVIHRRRRVRVHRHVLHREVAGDEGPGETGEREGDEEELALRRRPTDRHQRQAVAAGTHHGHDRLHQCQHERQHQREMSEFGNHWLTVAPAL